jgi:hypothetical protein
MESINILRLKTGEDIVCYMEQYGADEYSVRDPMLFEMHINQKTSKVSIVLDHWLPVYVLKDNEAIIKSSDVLTVLEATPELNQYYETSVQVFYEARQLKEKTDNTSASSDADLTEADKNLLLELIDLDNVKHIH